jgi:UDP-N-acetylglucosamine/UDP-N-acetyl-alpha-D-glucosaminouronate 4-epimerase
MLDLVHPGARYLVTGGAGFIGSNIVHALVAGGAEVRVVDDFSTGRASNLEDADGTIEVLKGTITDADLCVRAMLGVDFVLHQAALPSVPRSIANPLATHEACATGTLNLLVAARNASVNRFVCASSSSAYGNADVEAKYEALPIRPMSPYAIAKVAGELYARVFYDVYGMETVALRYFNVFGPRQDPESPYSAVVPLFISHALRGTSPKIDGDGHQTRDFTFVQNAVFANLLGCSRDADLVAGQVFNVGCGDRVSVNQLWKEICGITGATVSPTFGEPRPGDVRDSLASLERSTSLLGYTPKTSLIEGLQETVGWYENVLAAGVE